MKAEEFYEKQRVIHNTDDITTNPNPDYSEAFYQNIFWLMEQYHKEQLKDLLNSLQIINSDIEKVINYSKTKQQ